MMHRKLSQRPAIVLLAIFAMSGAPARIAAAAESTAPHIVDCRIGFDGKFKVGFWTPVWVGVVGDVAGRNLTVEVTTADSDGVEATTSTTLSTAGKSAEGIWPALLYAKVGRIGNPQRIALVANNHEVLDRFELQPGHAVENRPTPTALPATSELIVQIGPGSLALAEAYPDRSAAEGSLARRVVSIANVDALPAQWFGYESVDLVVLSTEDVNFCQRLAADTRRFRALRRWLEMGGRLVIFCGRHAKDLLSPDGPWAALVPGTFSGMVRLPQAHPLESFAETNRPLGQSTGPLDIPVPRLTDVHGRVELYGRGSELPLVVRAAHGFGERMFVGLDPSLPPLADWPGRPALLRALLKPYVVDTDLGSTPPRLVSLGYSDLAGAIRQTLGRSFSSVVLLTFPIVAGLVLAYLALLGPLDYLLVHKLLGRPWVAWITFPLLVVLTAGGAMWLANAAKGRAGTQINCVELVDFDQTTGQVRGTSWAALYSADARRFELALDPRLPNDESPDDAESRVAWLGLPGTGLGGMHAADVVPDVAGVSYEWSSKLNELLGVPILTASTKSFTARWEAPAKSLLSAKLHGDDDGLLVGTVKNETGSRFTNAYLLHGNWGYRLGNLEPGQEIEVGPQLNAIHVKTLIAGRARHASGAKTAGLEQEVFVPDHASLEELLNVLIFYDAVGGYKFVGLPSRYHAYCDLSNLLDLDRAVLVAGGTGRGSRWIDRGSAEPLGGEQDPSTIVYRFVLPLEKSTPSNSP